MIIWTTIKTINMNDVNPDDPHLDVIKSFLNRDEIKVRNDECERIRNSL